MTPSQLIADLPRLITLKRSLMIWGDPGIGKSTIIRQFTEAAGIGFIDLRLNLYDPTELKGYPIKYGPAGKERMRFAPSGRLPTSGQGIILCDELPSAPPATQNAAYPLVLDRRLDEYELPDGWAVIGAGNYAHNGGVHYPLAPALADRFIHLNLEISHDDWDAWAAANGVSGVTRAFIRFRPALLHDVKLRQNGQAFPTPRSWKIADEIYREQWPTDRALEYISGKVSKGPAHEFVAFASVAENLPTAQEIEYAPEVAPVPSDPGAKYAVVTMLESSVTPKNMGAFATYIKRVDLEFQAAFMTGVARLGQTKRELLTTKAFIDWSVANKNTLLA